MTNHRVEAALKAISIAEPMEVSFVSGLSSEQVKQRNKEGLINKTKKKVTKTYLQIFLDNFFSFFNVLLFSIAAIMIIAGLDWTYFFFLIVLFANIVIGLITDFRARRLVDKLSLITDPKVTVVRDGAKKVIPTDEVVLSDIMVLSSGDQICADGIVISGKLKVDESLLTGESIPIDKTENSQILSGSYVKSGTARVEVNRVGIANYAETLQDSAKTFERPKSEIKRSCLAIFLITGIISILIGLLSVATWLLKAEMSDTTIDFESFQRFAKSLSGMVAMIPSGMYLLTSLTLAVGVIHLAQKRMNVQELYCIEALARVDTLCMDKTGTLTDGNMSVNKLFNYSSFSDEQIKDAIGSLVTATQDNNATAFALTSFFGKGGMKASSSISFDSERKFSAATFLGKGTFIIGAYGFVEAERNLFAEAKAQEYAQKGFRVLCAYHNNAPISGDSIPGRSELLAVIVFSDHLKADAKDNVMWFRDNGVDIKVISGDNPITVSEIAKEAGVPGAEFYISMEGVESKAIPLLVNEYSVFGRVNPEQKGELIAALQTNGHKVAMVGDGVNDIVALKTADCSIAMADGSSAARNVAHMVSLDNDFSSLPSVVAEGRRVINNLQRTSSLFLSKTIFAIVLGIVFLISDWCGRGVYPFTTKNMMVWEVISIGVAAFFLALQPSKERLKGSFLENIIANAVPAGIVEILSVVLVYIMAMVSPSLVSSSAAKDISVLAFTALSYVYLFTVSSPLDLYRGLVFGLSLIAGAFVFFFDWLFRWELMGIDYSSLGLPQIAILLFVVVILSAFYFLLEWEVRRIITRIDARIKEKTT
jgi:cation-transporting P-type ATPase E